MDVVTEFIEGLVETYPGLQYLDGFPDVKVVLRADVSGATYDKVALYQMSGHEPAHAGFVGEGMLTAAICGDIFASPPVDSILSGIRMVTGSLGCLLIVKNYTGDRLNFGLAAEQAKSEGYKVEMVIVGDDCALPPPRGISGRRGLAGTILVHKVAGAAAAGLSLAEVAAEAKRASEMVGTMGVALSVCTLPGQVSPDRLGPGKMELGLGICGVNYTGDGLNFGLAAEQAKSEGYKVEMVIVDDDCALPPPRGISGRRGLAGTILVQKCYYESQVAGAAAAAGLSLSEVAAEAKRASEMVALYITMQACEFDLKRIVVPIKISWVPPSESFVKSNSDASWDWNQKQWTAAVIARGEMAIFNLLRFCL
ncbi:hypothetical protein OROGR_009487 [Orobanche gracilis]